MWKMCFFSCISLQPPRKQALPSHTAQGPELLLHQSVLPSHTKLPTLSMYQQRKPGFASPSHSTVRLQRYRPVYSVRFGCKGPWQTRHSGSDGQVLLKKPAHMPTTERRSMEQGNKAKNSSGSIWQHGRSWLKSCAIAYDA